MSDVPFNQPDGAPSVDLTPFDDEYTAVKAVDTSEVPDGRYQVRLNDVKLVRNRNGDPMLKWDLVVIVGPHAHRHIFKNAVISRPSLQWVKFDLQLLGLELSRFSTLPDHLGDLVDVTLEVSKRTAGEYVNVYFNKLLQAPAVMPPGPDDVPF